MRLSGCVRECEQFGRGRDFRHARSPYDQLGFDNAWEKAGGKRSRNPYKLAFAQSDQLKPQLRALSVEAAQIAEAVILPDHREIGALSKKSDI